MKRISGCGDESGRMHATLRSRDLGRLIVIIRWRFDHAVVLVGRASRFDDQGGLTMPKDVTMAKDLFFVCRLLCIASEKRDYVVFRKSELPRRHDVKAVGKGFKTEAEAEAEIKRLGGSIPAKSPFFLDFFDDDWRTVWCWKDDRTCGASQLFKSKRAALAAWRNDELVFETLLD